MSELKIESFWKSLRRVLGEARVPDRQMVNPWPIVKLEGVVVMPPELPRPSAAVAAPDAAEDHRAVHPRRSLSRTVVTRRTMPLFIRL